MTWVPLADGQLPPPRQPLTLRRALRRIACAVGFHDFILVRERAAPDAPLVVQRVYCRRCLYHVAWITPS